jgi:catechol 2,3-dioxygenase-like lactoylglutathione lyase family enzyme
MKMKSISGLTCYVKDLYKTASFYETLDFQFRKRDPDHMSVYLNLVRIDFLPADKEERPELEKKADLVNRGEEFYLYISVDNMYEFNNCLHQKGLFPSTEPKDQQWGNHEFSIFDPDGYKIVFLKGK